MIYDTSSSRYKSFLKTPWQSLAVKILKRQHGDNFKNATWFACILKSKVAVSCLTEILTRYAGRRQIGLLAGLPFTAKELTAVGKVFLRHFLILRELSLESGRGCTDCDKPFWNYLFLLLKDASGLGKSYLHIKPSTGLFSKNGPRMVSGQMEGTPNSVALRNMEYFPDTIGHLHNISPELLRRPISGKACWWCNRETDTKLKNVVYAILHSIVLGNARKRLGQAMRQTAKYCKFGHGRWSKLVDNQETVMPPRLRTLLFKAGSHRCFLM